MKFNENDAKRILAAVAAGRFVFVGEWRGFKPETINYIAKSTGQRQSFSRITHTVEVGEGDRVESYKVSERVLDGAKVEEYKPAVKRGQPVLIEVQSITQEKGNVTVNMAAMSPLAVGQ